MSEDAEIQENAKTRCQFVVIGVADGDQKTPCCMQEEEGAE